MRPENRRVPAVWSWWRWALSALLLLTVGCSPEALRIVEVRGPQSTADAVGPYAVTVVATGAVARARVVADYGALGERRVALESLGDNRYAGALPGAPAGTRITYTVTVESYGEDTQSAEGEPFEILRGPDRCLVDGDCGPGRICDRLRGQCKPPPETCRDDGDCGQDYVCSEVGAACRFRPLTCDAGAACDRGFVCEDGRCVAAPECRDDAACPPGQSCLVPPGRCVGAPECGLDADCPRERPRCQLGRCLAADPSACDAARPCPEGQVCQGGRCVAGPECRDDGQCGVGRVCRAGRCQDAEPECRDDDACGRGLVCDGGRCVEAPECRIDGDCPGGERCLQGRCAGACDCPADQRCHPDDARCVGCFADGQCPGGHCDLARGSCREGARTELCAACDAGQPCNSGLGCAADFGLPLCLPTCDDAGRCPDGFFCEGGLCLGEQICRGSQCFGDADCPDSFCSQGICAPRQPCFGPDDCAADRQCEGGRCVPRADACIGPQQCPPGQGCFQGRCVPSDPSDGCSPCQRASDCGPAALCVDVFGQGTTTCLTACGSAGCSVGASCLEAEAGLGLCLPDQPCQPVVEPPPCGRDVFEPNDDFPAATQVSEGFVFIEAATCEGDVDVYRVATLIGLLEVAAGASELIVEIWGRDQRLRRSLPLRRFDTQAFELGGDDGFVFVRGVGDNTDYQIIGELAPAACMDDNLEPNDGPDRATLIGPGADVRGRLCADNPDFFRLRVPRGRQLTLELDPGPGTTVSAALVTERGQALETIEANGGVDFDLGRYPDDARVFSLRCARCPNEGGTYRLRLR